MAPFPVSVSVLRRYVLRTKYMCLTTNYYRRGRIRKSRGRDRLVAWGCKRKGR